MNRKELEYKLIEITREYRQLLEEKDNKQNSSKKDDGIDILLCQYKNKRITNKSLMQEIRRKNNIIQYLKAQLQEKNKELEKMIKENNELELQIKKLKCKYKKKKDNITASKLRSTKEYKEFRLKILERDNNRCVRCGSTQKLQVHHIKPVNKFPELVMEESNVETLCAKCHIDTESYLKG